MQRLEGWLKLVDRLNDRVGRAVSFLMLPMLVIMIFEVFMRYGLDSPTIWGTEMSTFLFAGYILLGAGYTHLSNSHVNMNAFYSRLSRRSQAVLDLVNAVVFFLYCGVLFWQSAKFTLETILTLRHTGTDWNPPLWPALITLPIGVLLMLLQGVAKLVRDLILVLTGKEA